MQRRDGSVFDPQARYRRGGVPSVLYGVQTSGRICTVDLSYWQAVRPATLAALAALDMQRLVPQEGKP